MKLHAVFLSKKKKKEFFYQKDFLKKKMYLLNILNPSETSIIRLLTAVIGFMKLTFSSELYIISRLRRHQGVQLAPLGIRAYIFEKI